MLTKILIFLIACAIINTRMLHCAKEHEYLKSVATAIIGCPVTAFVLTYITYIS